MKRKPYAVTFDAKSYFLDGERTWLRAGEVHYFRIPRALWRDVLEKARRMGLNLIQTYIPWNYHEPVEGEFDFSGEKDLAAFLQTAAEVGLHVLARPGPYICGEWDFGGFPAWLLKKRGLQLRRFNPIYLDCVDRWFRKVVPIVAAHQATRGGPVIMMQIENELGTGGYGTSEEDRLYLGHLRDLSRELGVRVPLITCRGWIPGTVNGINAFAPAGDFEEARRECPDCPLYVTEFWAGWDDSWFKCTALMVNEEDVERESWLCLAQGGAGYCYYMFHGGTHFGLTTQYMQVTSYDDHAPLSEAGGFTEKFHRAARPTRYAQWFEELLAGSEAAASPNLHGAPAGLTVFQRRHARLGSLYFLYNETDAALRADLELDGLSLPGNAVEPHALKPLVGGVALSGKLSLAATNAIVAWRGALDGVPTLVLAADPGEKPRAYFGAHARLDCTKPAGAGVQVASGCGRDCGENVLAVTLDGDKLRQPVALTLRAGTDELRLVLVNRDFERRTFAADGQLVFGPYHVRPAGSTSAYGAPRSRQAAVAEFRPGEKNLLVYAPATGLKRRAVAAAPALPALPAPGGWRFAEDAAEAENEFDDSGWKSMFEPINRNYLDGGDGYAWYRVGFDWPWEEKRIFVVGYEKIGGGRKKHTFASPEYVRNRTLCISGMSDRALIFVNGRLAHTSAAAEWGRSVDPSLSVPIQLIPGRRNTIAVLTESLGHIKGLWQLREKFGSSRGMEDEAKGLFGPVYFNWGRDFKLQNWSFRSGLGGELAGRPAGRGAWRPLARASRNGALRWFRARFRLSREELAADDRPILLRPAGLKKGLFWLNGRPMGRYWMTEIQNDYYLPKPWLKAENEIILFEETAALPGRVRLVRDPIQQVTREVEL